MRYTRWQTSDDGLLVRTLDGFPVCASNVGGMFKSIVGPELFVTEGRALSDGERDEMDGCSEGWTVGSSVGELLGCDVGLDVGTEVGWSVGSLLSDGTSDGSELG